MIIDIYDLYVCCDSYILFLTVILLIRIYPEFISFIKIAIIVEENLVYYGPVNNIFHFCKSYYGITVERKISKFRSANYINISLSEKYFDILSDSTFHQNIFISCIHLIVSIIMLRFYSTFSFASYHCI